MNDATLLWSIWQALLQSFTWAFTRPGHRRFVEWVTALALNVEEHTVTQSVLALDRPADWRALERFAEYGRWDTAAVTRRLARLIEKAPGHLWHGYHVSAVDDGYALQTVIRPLVSPEDGSARIEFLTRLRHDARLYAPLPERHRPNQKWGRRLPPPRQGGRWTRLWHEGTAFIYGRQRKVRRKEVVCVWRVLGHDGPVKVVVPWFVGEK